MVEPKIYLLLKTLKTQELDFSHVFGNFFGTAFLLLLYLVSSVCGCGYIYPVSTFLFPSLLFLFCFSLISYYCT